MVPGEHGVPDIVVSQNLKQHRFSILGDAYENFAHYLSQRDPAARSMYSYLDGPRF